MYGFTKEEALGKVTQDLLHTGFPEPMDQIVAQVLRIGTVGGRTATNHLHRERNTCRESLGFTTGNRWRAVGIS